MSVNQIDIPDGLGLARPEPQRLRQIVATALGLEADRVEGLVDVRAEKVDYDIGTITTHALMRVRGNVVVDGADRPWSVFVKVLQSPWAWEHIMSMPEPVRSNVANNIPWQIELEAYRSGISAVLPDGMRQPHFYDAIDIDEQHLALWVEDVIPARVRWHRDRFVHAAELLGRLAARRPVGCATALAPTELSVSPGIVLAYYVDGRVRMGALPALADPSTWSHPTVATAVEASGDTTLQADLADAADRLDSWMSALAGLPHFYAHGDASPQNLLVPASDPSTFVVIDWGFNSPLAVGFDLGQLLIGLAHARELPVDALPDLVEAIVPAYHRGLLAEGADASLEQVRAGFVLSLAARSAFTALPVETLRAPPSPARTEFWVERIRLTRFMLDLVSDHQG